MSWFGEQFNTFTEKFTDFKREPQEENQHEILSRDKLLQLCQEKDEQIKLLMEERETFEKNLEELDQQHQEAIGELLFLKGNLIKENNELKIKLSKNDNKVLSDASQSHHDFLQVSFNGDMKNIPRNDHTLISRCSDSLKHYKNLIDILCSLNNCTGDNKLNDQIKLLKNETMFIDEESNTQQNKDKVEKSNYYLNCLDVVSVNNQTILPMLEDIASLVNLLLIDNDLLKKKCNSCEVNKLKDDEIPTVVEKIDSCNQTYSSSFETGEKIMSRDCFIQTDDLSVTDLNCARTESFSQTVINYCPSQYTQTEPLKCDNCLAHKSKSELISQLEADIYNLRQQNSALNEENHKLNSVAEKFSVSVQTDVNLCCKCKELGSQLEKVTTDFACAQSSFQEKEENFNLSMRNQLKILNDVKNELASKEKLLLNKVDQNVYQEKELTKLKAELSTLKSQLSMFGKQDYESNVDSCNIIKMKHQPNLCINCKNEMNMNNEKTDTTSHMDNEKSTLLEKLKNLEFEKSKVLCVLSEKTQECSSLKSEVHKLTSIVASEKQALMKLQQDNCDLKQSSKSNSDPELTKEAVIKLSRLVQDKDFEIESLKQKNSTLTALIAETSSVPEHIQSLIEERENLNKQINVFKLDREKIMKSYNAKDQECRQYLADIKKVNSLLEFQSEKFDILQQEHHSVAQQYEEKQKSLINTQNEMIALKQRVTDLEEQQFEIKEKYSELLNKINSDSMIQMTKEELSSKIQEIELLTRNNKEKDDLIQEKDCMIHNFTQQIKTLKMEFEREDSVLSSLRNQTTELKDNLKTTELAMAQLQEDKVNCEQRLEDKNSELALLKEMNDRLNIGIREKEYVIQSMTEKISSLSQYINNDHSNSSQDTDINRILADSESMFSKMQDLYRERDETLLSLSQNQQECLALRSEIQKLKTSEIHLKNELERLREHLLKIEENYTIEALKSEEREKELRDQLLEVSRRAEISSTAVVDTSQRASIQITSLQEQLRIIANQRDEALNQISELEDKVQKLSASINNLQFVLEQIQRGSEKKLKDCEKKCEEMVNKEKDLCKQLEKELSNKLVQLEESSQALEAANRLSEQLDAKEEIIRNLKDELSKIENKVKSSAQEIDSIKSNTEGKVDRVVMKSLVLGYFSTPPGQKSEVIRLLARVLDFNQEEMEKAGIIVQRNTGRSEQTGILSSIFRRWPLSSNNQQSGSQIPEVQKSFTTLFVQFLENESQPIVPMPFPAEKMAQQLTLKSQSSKKSQSPQKMQDRGHSPLLLSIDSAFPTFSPIPAVEYTKSPAPSILKEMLE